MRATLTLTILVACLLLTGHGTLSGTGGVRTVAVFPTENLAGTVVPVDEIRQAFAARLTSEGIAVLDADALEAFIVRHRVRYLAGLDSATARFLRDETGVDGVLIPSVGLWIDSAPPKVALTARLVAVDEPPTVIWADDTAIAGDDAPGLLELGLVNDYGVVMSRALERVTGSLAAYLRSGTTIPDSSASQKFRPRVAYNGMRLEPGRTYSVAVVPFFNRSSRRNAGPVLALLFMRHLSAVGSFRVIDAGEVRQQLLRARIIMDGGISISDADLVGTVLDADFVLGGRVLYYDDYAGPDAAPRVDFSTVVIETKSRKVVWSSQSYRAGDEGVRFFGRGRSRTAHLMATQMVRLVSEMIEDGPR